MNMVSILMQNPDNTTIFSNEILSVVRPVMINSFNEAVSAKMNEVQLNLEDTLNNIQGMLTKNGNNFENINLNSVQDIGNQIKTHTDKIFKNNKAYKSVIGALGLATTVVAPWVELVLFFAPDILNYFFGESEDDKRNKFTNTYLNSVIPDIKSKLDPVIESTLLEQNTKILNEIEESIAGEIEKLEEGLNEKRKKQEENKANVEALIERLDFSMEKLLTIKSPAVIA